MSVLELLDLLVKFTVNPLFNILLGVGVFLKLKCFLFAEVYLNADENTPILKRKAFFKKTFFTRCNALCL
jgi:hypothetical protein